MSQLSDLIKKCCPNGVEYKPLGEVCEISRGVRVTRDMLSKEGAIPVYQNALIPLGYFDKSNREGYKTFVIGAGAAGKIGFSDVDFWAADDCYTFDNSQNLDNKFLFYFLQTKQDLIDSRVRKGSIPRISRDVFAKLSIPVPPLPVQEEIVRILDNFTKLTAELTAELTARRAQYEYYRDALLKFDFLNGGGKKVKLGDICEIKVGGEPPKNVSKIKDDEHPYPIWGNGKEVYGYANSYKIDKDAVAISSIGANTGAVFFHKAFFTPIIRLKVLLPKNDSVLSKYLYYACSLIDFNSKKSSVPNMSAADVKSKEIPLPPLEEQERIVAILDRFDRLCNDISEGLPAEIEARRKQYEYYRDKLLAFNV